MNAGHQCRAARSVGEHARLDLWNESRFDSKPMAILSIAAGKLRCKN
jgi:hypothetical protein